MKHQGVHDDWGTVVLRGAGYAISTRPMVFDMSVVRRVLHNSPGSVLHANAVRDRWAVTSDR